MAYTPDPTWVDGAGGSTPITAAKLNNMEAGIVAAAVTADIGTAGTATGNALRAAYVHADPVLSAFSYDATTGNLLSYQEDGITITLTYNADGTVATSTRGSNAAKTYSYSGGNLVGVA